MSNLLNSYLTIIKNNSMNNEIFLCLPISAIMSVFFGAKANLNQLATH